MINTEHPIGRDSEIGNNVFFTCSLIDYIARKTFNHRKYVANSLGGRNIEKIIDLADIYHSDNLDKVADDFIQECKITNGTFDNVKDCKYSIPTYWDIGKVYKRLVLRIAQAEDIAPAQALLKAYNSFVSEKIEDYNSSFYYENPEFIYQCYVENRLIG